MPSSHIFLETFLLNLRLIVTRFPKPWRIIKCCTRAKQNKTKTFNELRKKGQKEKVTKTLVFDA